MEIAKEQWKDFLEKKGIEPKDFQASLPVLFARCQTEYEMAGAPLLEYGKKFFWNDLRKEFPRRHTNLA